MKPNTDLLKDFFIYSQAELASNDIAPWADLFRVIYEEELLPRADAWWLTTLYNTYDRTDSAWRYYQRWPSLARWNVDPRKADAASHQLYPRTGERRNLHGGSVLRRLQSYSDILGEQDPLTWLCQSLDYDSPGADFATLTLQMRQVWGVGRQAAFEWAEFAGKVIGLPIDAADGQFYESSGPRQSIERMYNAGNKMTEDELNWAANDLQARLSLEGMDVPFVDLETMVCDFNVMRNGRYFVGRHLTALRGEVQGFEMLEYAFSKVVPKEWADVPAGLEMDPVLRKHYKTTGEIFQAPWW